MVGVGKGLLGLVGVWVEMGIMEGHVWEGVG